MAWEPQKLQYWHEVLMDFYILNPAATNQEAADALGVHALTVQLVRSSDLWQARFEARKLAFVDKADAIGLQRLNGKVLKLAETGVDVLTNRIEQERKNLGLATEGVRETTDMALKALGYGTKVAPTSKTVNHTQVNILVSAEELAEARRRMRLQVEHENGHPDSRPGAPALPAAAGL